MARSVLPLPVPLYCVCATAGGRWFAAGGGGESRTGVANSIFELSVSRNGALRLVRTEDTGRFAVMNMAVSPRGDYLVTGEDESARIYDLSAGIGSLRTVETDAAADSSVPPRQRGVVFNAGGDLFATTGEDCKIRVWKCPSLKRERTFTGHLRVVRGLDFNSYGSQVVSVAEDGTCKIWLVGAGTMLRTFNIRAIVPGAVLRSCVFTRDTRSLLIGLSAEDAAQLLILRADTGEVEGRVRLLPGRLSCMAYSPCGQYIAASAGEDGAVAICAVRTQEVMLTATVGSFPLTAMAFSADSRFVVAVSMDGYARSVRVFPGSNWLRLAWIAALTLVLLALYGIWWLRA